MPFFRRKRSKPFIAQQLAEDGDWRVATATSDGQPMVVRLRADLDGAPDQADWPIRMGIAIPLNNPSPEGLPLPEEDQALGYIEAMACSAVAERAVLAIVITTSSMREFVLHAQTSDWIPEFHNELQASVPSHRIQVVAHRDESWSVYNSFWT